MNTERKNTVKKRMLSLALFIGICVSGISAEEIVNIGISEQAYVGKPTIVKVKLLDKSPVISEELKQRREEALRRMRHVPERAQITAAEKGERIVVTKEAMSRNVPPTVVDCQEENAAANPPTGADSDFVFFENNDIGTAGAPTNQRSYVNEPSVANNGRCVFYSGNWYASLSVDGGKTFQYINPYTAFGWPAGQNFCCDQVVIYDPSRDCLFWLLQSTQDGSTNNIHKIAVANSFSDIENQVWYTYDFNAQHFGAADGSWLDFPDLVLGKNYLYHTANYIGPNSSAVIARYPLDALSTGSGFGFGYIAEPWPDKWVFRAVQGATTSTTMYWAAHNSTNSIRIYRWNEGNGNYAWDNVAVSGWDDGTRHAAGPDGKEWLNHFPSAGGYILGAWMTKGTLGFMWCADEDAAHPYPFVRVARFNQSDRTLINEPDIWWNNFAWAFPSVNVNGRGDIAGSLMYGGGSYYPSCSVFIWDDYSITPPGWDVHTSVAGTSGPKEDRFGDYLTTRICFPYSNTWLASAYTLQGGDQSSNAVPRFLWFGRERDRPFYALANDTPVTFTEVPKDFSFKTIGVDWCGLAMNPSTDHDIEADDDFRFQNVYEVSGRAGTERDFIVTDGHDFGNATLYAKVSYGSSSSYSIEAEWMAWDIVVGNPIHDSMDGSEIIQVYEANVISGNQYEVSVDITNGAIDVAVFGFEASRSSGNRNSADWQVDAHGAGGDESVTFTAESDGDHGIVVINENAQGGSYELLIELVPEPLGIWIIGLLVTRCIMRKRRSA